MVALRTSGGTVPSLLALLEVVSPPPASAEVVSSSPVSYSAEGVPPQPPSTRSRTATSSSFGAVLSTLETGVMQDTILTNGGVYS